jgi:hypothetical protein
MNDKMKQCFTPHVLMHSLIGLGLGLIVADIWSGTAKWWIGLILVAIGAITDLMRKA